jgi:hypothetical protein
MAVGTLWASRGLVFLCCHVQSVNAKIVEVIPSRAAAVLLPLSGISLLLGYQLATFEVDQSKVQIATIWQCCYP